MESTPSIQDLGGPSRWSHIAGTGHYQRLEWLTTICPAKYLAAHDGLNPAAAEEHLPPVKPCPPRVTSVGALLLEAVLFLGSSGAIKCLFLERPWVTGSIIWVMLPRPTEDRPPCYDFCMIQCGFYQTVWAHFILEGFPKS